MSGRTANSVWLRLIVAAWVVVAIPPAIAADATSQQPPAGLTPEGRGYWFLTQKAYLPPDFNQATIDSVWTRWPEPLRTQAAKAAAEERRAMTFSRYGLTPRPEDPTRPLQYVVDAEGNWTMNCFACHGGKVAGQVWPGLPNSHYALATLTEETREVKIEKGLPLARMDLGSFFVPLGATNGTTNAVNFGVALMAFRDANLDLRKEVWPPKMLHHDLDAPAWWHFSKKQQLYIDGFAEKGHRGLMQFMMVRSNGPEKFREWEADFRDVFAYISSLQPPKYPYAVDAKLAAEGAVLFERSCSECHGTYGNDESYPERLVPIQEIGTDRVRLDSLSPAHRDSYGQSWFADFGKKKNLRDPGGYVAPPLDGIWASAPYLHNGSVPTLWHLLHPQERPKVWQRSENGYDQEKVGLEVATFSDLPSNATTDPVKRTYFDTRLFGKSPAGHTFPDKLSEPEKRAVLEYLKIL